MEYSNKKEKDLNSISREIKSIINEMLSSLLNNKDDLGSIKIKLEHKIRSIADQNEVYNTIIKDIEDTIGLIRQFQTILFEIQDSISKSLEERKKFSETWWNKSQERLKALIKDDINKSFDYWMQLYCEALINWKLDICLKLSQEPYEFLIDFSLGKNFFQNGTNAIISEVYDQAIEMLNYLVINGLKYQSNESLKLIYALVNIFIGRYYLYKDSNEEQAKLHFETAISLSPEDGRPYAGLGNYYYERENYDEAFNLFSRSIEKSPNQPEGYVGMGLIAEAKKNFNEAEYWYNQAINSIIEEEEIVIRLNMLLAKGSDRLYIQIARFLNEKQGEEFRDQALKAVELALSLVEYNSKNERVAYRIKGEILEKSKCFNEAADAYHEAGKRYYWASKFDIGEELFYSVKRINENHLENYWYLADTLRIQSYKPKYPFIKPKIIEKSLAIWDAGFDLEKPKTGWPYLIRSMITEKIAEIEKVDKRPERLWEAVAYLECAFALNYKPLSCWATLIRLYSNLELDAMALHSMCIPTIENQKDLSFLDQQIITFSNIGEYELAIEIIEKRLEIEESPWVLAVKGYNKFYLKEYETALNAIEEASNQDPTLKLRTWVNFHCAMCYRIIGKNQEALNKFNEIWKDFKSLKRDYTRFNEYIDYIDTAFYLDGFRSEDHFLDLIIELTNNELNNKYKTRESTFYSHLFLGLAYLKKYNFKEGELHLILAVEKARFKKDIDHINILLLELQQQLNERLEQPEIYEKDDLKRKIQENNHRVKNVLNFIQHRSEIRLEDFCYLSVLEKDENIRINAAIEEIENEFKKFNEEGKKEGYACIGLNITLVRWYEITKNWSSKLYNAYQELFKHRDKFPVVEKKLKSTIDLMSDIGKSYLEEEKLEEALNLFEQIIKLMELGVSEYQNKLDLLSRIGFIYFQMNKTNQTFEIWKRAIEIYNENLPIIEINKYNNPGQFIGNVCLSFLKRVEDCWSLIDKIEDYINTIPSNDAYITDFIELKTTLFDFFNQYFQLKKESASTYNMVSVVTPIEVEVGKNLIPEDDKDWDFIRPEKGILHNMRERIKEHMNIKVPGIRIRGNETDFSPNSYKIMLNENPIVSGEVYLNMGYCLESPDNVNSKFPTILKKDLVEITDPMTGIVGCWIPTRYWNLLNNNDIEIWKDPMIFIAHHIETILYQNFDKFLGIQEVKNLLDDWEKQNDDNRSLREIALPDQKTQLVFTRILRNLVKEKVPIKNIKKILDVIKKVDLINDDIDEIIRKIRLELKLQLPGNEEDIIYRYIEPIEEFEKILLKFIENKKDKKSIKIPPEKIEDLLYIIRSLVNYEKTNQVLIIERAELRPLARDIVKIEFPNLIVIAEEERIK